MTAFLKRLFGLEGRIALVTGGSSGIGTMIAAGLIDAGARVVITSRKRDNCERIARELAFRGSCVAVPADISDPDGIEYLVQEMERRFDRLDVLVNNAGATWGDELEAYPRAAWEKVLNTNVVGPFELTVALLPMLRAARTQERPARVINVGSANGVVPPSTEAYAYSASKAAVHMLTRHLARRLASEHITVNTLAPGLFASRMSAFALGDEDLMRGLVGDIPLGRIGGADDIVAAALLLAGHGGSWMTGTTIAVDGGITGCG